MNTIILNHCETFPMPACMISQARDTTRHAKWSLQSLQYEYRPQSRCLLYKPAAKDLWTDCQSSTERGMIAFGDCSWSLLTSLGTICHKWHLLFLRGYCTGSLYCTKYCGFKTICQNDNLASFYGFKSKRLFRMNLMHGNTDKISHVLILTWPGMTPFLTSHESVNDITQPFSLNWFLVLSFDTKMSHLRRRQEILRANQCDGNVAFISINVSFRETVPLKTFPWIFPDPNFIKKILSHSMYQMV